MLGIHNLVCTIAFILSGFQMFPADWSIIYMWIGCVGVLAYYEQQKRGKEIK